MKNKEKVIGVLGGMGPEATASFYRKVIRETKVQKDQDHFRTIIDSNPKIPDRTEAILYDGPSPVSEMVRTAKNLQQAGATVAVMPCITAHYFYSAIQNEVSIPIHHVLKGLNAYINEDYPDVDKIGVLSTSATKETGLFQQHLLNKEIVYPNAFEQENKVMRAIYGENGIKQGNTGNGPKQLLLEVADRLIKEEHCELIIGGCTEVELVLHSDDMTVPFIDPMRVAARDLTKSKTAD
ncbi:aspartate racemase [Alkalibacterium subtropicum]|uniref:Aspartate racemase n=1 Tax=Alkalibacterium subtropicum TaxID=753702 RepID=A0A1I1L849_9LACT|nr:amino acid racemase [Alkalibacterium subtropicum]SFC69176.1 aspartate racemase [Alkalibacterium subtropicum]